MKRTIATAGMIIFAAANMGYAAGEAAFERSVERLLTQIRETRSAWQADLRLLSAAEAGDLVLAGYALENGADINATSPNDYHGRTALMIASSKGDISMAVFLVSHRADVNKKGTVGNTALHFASGFGHYEVAKYLMDSGADVNAADNTKYTALHMAAFNDSAGIVRLLLARGAEVDAKTKEGQTPLALAKIRGNEEIVRILSEAGGRGAADKASALAGEFERHLAAGNIFKAHEAIMASPPREFAGAIKAVSGGAFVVYINRLYEITKVHYLDGYQSLQLNAFVRKLYYDAGERLTDSIVLNKIKPLADQETVHGPASSAYGYLVWLLKNPNDLQVNL